MKLPSRERIEQVLVRNDVDRGLIDTLLLDYDYGFVDTFVDRLINEMKNEPEQMLLDELRDVKDELDDTKADLEEAEEENMGLEDDYYGLEERASDYQDRIEKLRKYIRTKFDNNYLEGDEDE